MLFGTMPKKKIQKSDSEPVFASSEVMSLLEHMSEGIEIISETQNDTNRRLDRIEIRLDEHDVRFDTLEMKFVHIQEQVTVLTDKTDKIQEQVIVLTDKTDRLQDDVTEIKHKLSEKVDMADFKKLEKRMMKLERLVFAKLG